MFQNPIKQSIFSSYDLQLMLIILTKLIIFVLFCIVNVDVIAQKYKNLLSAKKVDFFITFTFRFKANYIIKIITCNKN